MSNRLVIRDSKAVETNKTYGTTVDNNGDDGVMVDSSVDGEAMRNVDSIDSSSSSHKNDMIASRANKGTYDIMMDSRCETKVYIQYVVFVSFGRSFSTNVT